MRAVRFTVAILAVLSFTTLVSAQQTTGTLIGKIADEQGGLIPGATVTASNPSTGFNRTAVSDSEGVYRLSALPVGQLRPEHRTAPASRRSNARASSSTSARRSRWTSR